MLGNCISVVSASKALGAEIISLDIGRTLPDHLEQLLLKAWHDYGVIILRNQTLTKEGLISFSTVFGAPEQAAPQERALIVHAESREVMIVSNVVENGKPIGHLGNKEAYWHTDMCYMPVPPTASILYAIEVPKTGGDTCFMNMYTVYDRLPSELKTRVSNLSIKHDRSYTAVGDLRHGYDPVDDVSKSPGAVHPMVRRHPVTGRAALYLGRRLNAYVDGLPNAESEALLDELWHYTADPDLVWRHQWRVGDIAIWDNRCVMHRRDAFDPDSRRIMWRTQMQADARGV